MKLKMRKIFMIILWIILWQVIASFINKPVLFASFTDCLKAFNGLFKSSAFWISLLYTTTLILLGIAIAYIAGIVFGIINFKYSILYDFFQPLLAIMKAVPVACFAVLVLIWFGSKILSIIVSFIVIFPQVYYATIEGLKNRDIKMVEMANVNRMKLFDRLLYVDRLAITPYIVTISKSAISMGVKSSIAAELIGLASYSIGQQLYYCKLYLDTAELFCYSFVIILISFVIEKLTLALISAIGGNYD